MAQLTYIPKKCIGCGSCAQEMPQVWQMNPITGKAELFDSILRKDYYYRALLPDEVKKSQQMAHKCPTKAIIIQ